MPKQFSVGDYVVLKEGARRDGWIPGRKLIGARGIISDHLPSREGWIVQIYMVYGGFRCERNEGMLLYSDEINFLIDKECPYAKEI